MRARGRAALAAVVVMTAPLVVGQVSVAPADAVTQVAERPGKKGDKPKADRPRSGDRDRNRDREKRKRDRKPPAVPLLGDPGVGPGGRVSLPIIADSGTYVRVAEVRGPVVATGTGVGGYASLAWTTSHGSHGYVVTATDRAGNRSAAARTSVFVDAIPPRLREVRLTPGTPSDTRTRLRFTTDAGSSYRVLVDGRQVASGQAEEPRAERPLDLADGRHRVQLLVRDATGNVRSEIRPVAVRIPALAVGTRITSDPTESTQGVRVRATPTATRGVVRIPGRPPVRFEMRRGSVTIGLELPEGTYRKGRVVVRDTWGRTGRTRVPALTVDTSPPRLAVDPDIGAAADGSVRATVTADDDATVRWRLIDSSGAVATSGELAADDTAVTSDVDKGRYQLVVVATDSFDRSTTVRSTVEVAHDLWYVVLRGVLWTLGTLLVLAGLVQLVRWARRPQSPLWSAVAAVRAAADRRLQVFLGLLPRDEAAATGLALFEPDAEPTRVPQQRPAGRAGGTLPADDQVLHRTEVLLYDTTEEHDDEVVLGSRTGELMVARDRLAFVEDRTGEVWSARIAALTHVGEDTTMVLPAGEDRWIGLVYGDRELTRPVLDLVAADQSGQSGQSGRRLARAGRA